jgi:hypothetical protein
VHDVAMMSWAEFAEAEPEDNYVLFELKLSEARCKAYGDVTLPTRSRWSHPSLRR